MQNRIYTYLFVMMLMLTPVWSFAQMQLVEDAYRQVSEGKLDSAKLSIDKATLHEECKNDMQAWLVKGFVYKELYKSKEINNHNSPLREESVKALEKATELDKGGQSRDKINAQLKFLAAKYYNDAGKTMDTLRYTLSISNFEKYLNISRRIDNNFDPRPRELEFYLALTTPFQTSFEDKKKEWEINIEPWSVKKKYLAHFFEAEKYLKRAVASDPCPKTAYKNLALLWYNRGVNLIMNCPPDIDIPRFIHIQDTAIYCFKQAEPLGLKALSCEPCPDPILIEMMFGVYYQLNDKAQYKYNEKLLEVVRKKRNNGDMKKYCYDEADTNKKKKYVSGLQEEARRLVAEDERKQKEKEAAEQQNIQKGEGNK